MIRALAPANPPFAEIVFHSAFFRSLFSPSGNFFSANLNTAKSAPSHERNSFSHDVGI
jgi:hypothetical protein